MGERGPVQPAVALPPSQPQFYGPNSSSSRPVANAASAAASAAVGSRTSSIRVPLRTGVGELTSPVSAGAVMGARRVWVRRRGTKNQTATSLMVDADELVDDLKMKILLKYPTTLLQQCDPADLVVKASVVERQSLRRVPSSQAVGLPSGTSVPGGMSFARSRSSSRAGSTAPPPPNLILNALAGEPRVLELQPDETIGAVVSKWYPNGMTMADAFEVGPRDTAVSTPDASATGRARNSTAATLSAALSQTRLAAGSGASRTSAASNLNKSGSHHLTSASSPVPPVPAVPQAAGRPTIQQQPSGTRLSEGTKPYGSSSSAAYPNPREPVSKRRASIAAPGKGDSEKGVLLLPRLLKVTNALQRTHKEKSDSGELNDADISIAASLASGVGNATGDGNAGSETALQRNPNLSPAGAGANGKNDIVVPEINVLIVEDNVINQKILEAFMRKKKVRYNVAKDGRDALAKWRGGGFHLILMDIQLPEMTGLEVTKEIRRLEVANGIGAFPQNYRLQKESSTDDDILDKSNGGFRSPVIIVALTASSDLEDKSEALAVGCNDFLTKPVNLMWLEQKIIEWGCMQALIDFDGWKYWLRHDETPQLKQISNNSPSLASSGLQSQSGPRASSLTPTLSTGASTPALQPTPQPALLSQKEQPIT